MEGQGSPSALKNPHPSTEAFIWIIWSRLREDLRGVAHNKVKTKR